MNIAPLSKYVTQSSQNTELPTINIPNPEISAHLSLTLPPSLHPLLLPAAKAVYLSLYLNWLFTCLFMTECKAANWQHAIVDLPPPPLI